MKTKEELKIHKNHEPLLCLGLKSFPDSSCAPAPLIGQIGWYLICAISPEYIRWRPEYIIQHSQQKKYPQRDQGM